MANNDNTMNSPIKKNLVELGKTRWNSVSFVFKIVLLSKIG